MGVEFEYFYLLHSKTKSSYNFTQQPRIKLWWFQSIRKNKQTIIFLNKTMNNKKNQIFVLHVLFEWNEFFCFFVLNVSLFELKAKMQKNVVWHVSELPHNEQCNY
jgi:hypothetical protein